MTRTGAPKIALDIFDALPDIDLRIIAAHGGSLEKRCRTRAPVRVLEPARRRWKSPLPLWARVRLKGQQLSVSPFVRGFKPDLIYANSIESLHILRYVSLPDAPIMCHVHELEGYLEPFAQRLPHLFARPQKYIAVAECVSQALQKLSVEPHRIEVVHEFVDAAKVDETTLSSRNSPADRVVDDVFVVGGAGSPVWRKGFSMWLQMALSLTQMMGRKRVRFVWVGFEEQFEGERFRREAFKMGLSDVVEFVPVTDNPQAHFARFDVFAMTSWEDPCPLVVLENMLLQTPVACFAPGGGAHEEVGETGIVLENFEPHQMAQHIAQLLQNEAQRKNLGIKARERVLHNFTETVQVPKIWQEMMRVANNQSSPRT